MLLLPVGGAPVSAQLGTAELAGRVTDPAGAALVGATVSITQVDTGYSRTTATDAGGAYVFSNLPTGAYRLEVSFAGFRRYVQTGIVLAVESASVINASLLVGAFEESVSVEQPAPLVDVESAGTHAVVRQRELLALPLDGRNPVELVTLTSGAAQILTSSVTALPGGLGVSVAGGQSFGVTYRLDGAIHNGPQDSFNLPFPFPDALQEFSVATGALNAQHGVHSAAAVNAVTKSGTNRLSGDAFEFFRDRRFNATNPFARIGPDGDRVDDGLSRNQFGATLGGPLVRNRLFFFAGYQGTSVHERPAANIAWVPTPAMMAGDFTAVASPSCNGGRAISLGGGFKDNQIDPTRFSPAAVNLVAYLPQTTDPCGEVTYSLRRDNDQSQFLGRIDFQRTADDTIFGRYMATTYAQVNPMGPSDTVLSLYDAEHGRGESGFDDLAQSLAIGDTRAFGSGAVSALRFAFNRSAVQRFTPDTFDPLDLGIHAYSYYPHVMAVGVDGGFTVFNQGPSRFVANSTQASEDLTLVRGRHQVAVGGDVAYWQYELKAHGRSGGDWEFTGQATGLGLADFLLGRVSSMEQGGPGYLTMDQWYVGLYAQDTWRPRERLTINTGVRWEPYFGQSLRNGAIYNFNADNFRENVESTVFTNAPAGLIYPGDAGFPPGKRGLFTKWWNFGPRVSLGWDMRGDGRTALRAGYGISYDFPTGEYQLMNAQAPPFGNRTLVVDPPGGFDDPYAHLGGNPHPIITGPDTQFVPYGVFGATDPEIDSPRIQQWNATFERQLGSSWQIAATYIGRHSDRLWNQVAINPGVFLGLGPCTLDGVFYATCSTAANLNQRRELSLSGENPAAARLIGNLDLHTDLGTQDYSGLMVSLQRRAIRGFSLSGNYTFSRCHGDPSLQSGGFPLIGGGYTNPHDPAFDRGICDQDRTHIANFTVWAMTPKFASRTLRMWASDWSFAGIVSVRSGSPVNVVTGQDRAFSGILNQRVDQVLEDPYGARTVDSWLNPAAFQFPEPGKLGNFRRNGARAPGFRSVDVAVSKIVPLGADRRLEFRVEAFNALNTFNWGSPASSSFAGRNDANFSSPSFGRITSMAGTPRVLQFGVKYSFERSGAASRSP